MKTGTVMALGVAALGTIWLFAQGAGGGGAGTCRNLDAFTRYEGYYKGRRKLLPDVLGDAAWESTYYVEIYSNETDDWEQPADPEHYYLEPNSLCAIMVQAPARVCGFDWFDWI